MQIPSRRLMRRPRSYDFFNGEWKETKNTENAKQPKRKNPSLVALVLRRTDFLHRVFGHSILYKRHLVTKGFLKISKILGGIRCSPCSNQ